MKTHTIYNLRFKREREQKTNYRSRLKLLRSGKPRLVARLSSKNSLAQIVIYGEEGDKITASASSKQLVKLGWKGNTGNLSATYLVGFLLAKNAKKAKVAEAVLDIGLQTSVLGSRLYALLKGAVDGGLDIPHSEEAFPPEERMRGKHIAEYAKLLKAKEPETYKQRFSGMLKSGLNPEEIEANFDSVKKKIEAI